MPHRKGLTSAEEIFALEFAKHGKLLPAYKSAYPNDKCRLPSQNAYKVQHRPKVAARIAELRAKKMEIIEKTFEVTIERLVEEYAKIAFANMANYTRVSGGDPNIDLSNVTLDQFAAVAEVSHEGYFEGRDEDKREIKKTKIKLHDKRGALDSLMRHLGGFNDKSEVSHKFSELTDEERIARVTKILNTARERGDRSPPQSE